MKVKVYRLKSDDDASVGILSIDGKVICGTVEDEYRTEKKAGETRVPAGIYKIGLRTEGGFHNRYSKKFPEFHEGMLCVYNSDNWKIKAPSMSFQYILIHLGNHEGHTSGCLLVNYGIDFKSLRGSNSAGAYKDVYVVVLNALKSGEEVTIEYIDQDITGV